MQLCSATEDELKQVVLDTKMDPGHANRLYEALGKSAETPPTPPQAPAPPQVPPQVREPVQQAMQPLHPAPHPHPQLMAVQMNKQIALKNKLLERDPIANVLKEGNLIETFADPDGKCVVAFDSDKWFCTCCRKGNPRSADGSRSLGIDFTNVKAHLGSKKHWTDFRTQVLKLHYEEDLWLEYTKGNHWGPGRAKKRRGGEPTVAAVKRESSKALSLARKHPKQAMRTLTAAPYFGPTAALAAALPSFGVPAAAVVRIPEHPVAAPPAAFGVPAGSPTTQPVAPAAASQSYERWTAPLGVPPASAPVVGGVPGLVAIPGQARSAAPPAAFGMPTALPTSQALVPAGVSQYERWPARVFSNGQDTYWLFDSRHFTMPATLATLWMPVTVQAHYGALPLPPYGPETKGAASAST